MGKSNRPSFIRRQEERLKEFEKADAEGIPVVIKGEETEDLLEQAPEVKETNEAEEQEVIDQGNDNVTGEVSKADFDKLQASYDVLKNKYDIEIKNLIDTTRSQTDLIKKQEEIIETLKANRKTPDDKGEKKASTKIDESKYEGYEEDTKEIIRAHNAQVEIIESLQSELEAIKQSTGNVTKKIDFFQSRVDRQYSNSFNDSIRAEVEDYDVINGNENGENADPRWVKYLDGVDPYSRLRRRDIAMSAIQRGDSDHIVTMLNDFKKVTNYQTSVKTNKLEKQIVPGIGGGRKPVVNTTIKKVTREQYLKASKDRQHRKISDDEWKAIEKGYEQTLLQEAGG